MKKINKIYIAGALTHAEPQIRKVYERLGEIASSFCKEVHLPHVVSDPINTPHLDAQDVWKRCHFAVASSDLIIAYVGDPSLGVGQELEIARVTHSEIIMWWFAGQKISRMALGNPCIRMKLEAKSEEHLYSEVEKALRAYLN